MTTGRPSVTRDGVEIWSKEELCSQGLRSPVGDRFLFGLNREDPVGITPHVNQYSETIHFDDTSYHSPLRGPQDSENKETVGQRVSCRNMP